MTEQSRDLRAIAVRVPPEVWNVLDAARMVKGYRGLQDLLRPVLETEADRWSKVEEVKTILRSVKEYQAREEAIRSEPSATDPK